MDYTLIKDAYYGIGGFETGLYLEKHQRETDSNYLVRRRMSYYLNYFKPIVDSLVNPIFRKKIYRNWHNGADIDAFIEDVDCARTALSDFIHLAALKAKLYGKVYIVVDNFEEIPANMADAVQQRRLPYAYLVEPSSVDRYAEDKAGRLISITFRDVIELGTNGLKERYITYDSEHWQIDEDGRTVSRGEHGLGRCPVIRFSVNEMEISDFGPLARVCRNLFNVQSWLTEILKNQTFSVLLYPSLQATNLEIGTNNALAFDGETSKFQPSFIAPPSEPASILLQQQELLVQEMYRVAGLSFVTGTKQEASGVAKAWEFERTNQMLVALAQQCQHIEREIMRLFELWQKTSIGYEVSYPNDFGIVDVQTELANAQAVLDMDFGSDVKTEVLKQVLNAYVPDLPAETFDELIASEKEQALDETEAVKLNGDSDTRTR